MKVEITNGLNLMAALLFLSVGLFFQFMLWPEITEYIKNGGEIMFCIVSSVLTAMLMLPGIMWLFGAVSVSPSVQDAKEVKE